MTHVIESIIEVENVKKMVKAREKISACSLDEIFF